MEIEPVVRNVFVVQLGNNLCEFISNSLLTPLLVDQVHAVLFRVLMACLCKMHFCGLVALVKVRVNDNWGRPLHVGLHGPKQGN